MAGNSQLTSWPGKYQRIKLSGASTTASIDQKAKIGKFLLSRDREKCPRIREDVTRLDSCMLDVVAGRGRKSGDLWPTRSCDPHGVVFMRAN